MLNEVFTVASLPEDGWKMFNEICGKYEKGALRKQRALPKDLKGKPTFRPVYIRCLLGLDVADRLELLKKVAEEESSLDEMKAMANDLKALRPVQKSIAASLGTPWDEVEQKFGDEVHPSILRRFIGKNESSVAMKEYLQRIQRTCTPDENDDVDSGCDAHIYRRDNPLDIRQAELRNTQGVALAIYRFPNGIEEQNLKECMEKVLKLVARLNFGVKQFYNIVIIGSTADIAKAAQWIKDNHSGENEVGFFAWKPSTAIQSGNLGMVSCVESFLVHHAAVGNHILPEHFSFGENVVSNLIGMDFACDLEVKTRLIQLFSHELDWILDINSTDASACLMALKAKRSAIYLCQSEDEEFHAKRGISDIKRNLSGV